MIHAIGLVELNSIAKGIESADIMEKTADVSILLSKTTCPGKYITLIGGDVSSVEQSVRAGIELGDGAVIDSFVIPNVHPTIIPAISGTTEITVFKAIGVIETFSVAALIEAADAAVKAAEVEPIRIHLAYGIGGKSYTVLTGEVAAVKAAVATGSQVASDKGLLVQNIVIPHPGKQLLTQLT